MTRERPILFSPPMVRAILDGRKTQTRRVVKRVKMHEDHGPPIWDRAWVDGQADHQYLKVQYGTEESHPAGGTVQRHFCPWYPGDRLWVREAWAKGSAFPLYRADFSLDEKPSQLTDEWNVIDPDRWRPGIHMPRSVCRLRLEVTGVRVERLQAISENDAKAEGAPQQPIDSAPGEAARNDFAYFWEQINGSGSWNANPWVWVVAFKRADAVRTAA